jgi:hypothetical protein
VYCANARHRLADAWRQLKIESEPPFADVARAWLSGADLDFMLRDVVATSPPPTEGPDAGLTSSAATERP